MDRLSSSGGAAALMSVGVSTFRPYVARGLVRRPVKLGGTSSWPQSEILAVIEAAKAQRDTNPQSKENV